MAMKKRYHTVNGMLIGETSNGVRRGYLPDALGSAVATVDDNGSIENTYRYKPYGSLLAKTGTAADPRFLWAGTSGYRTNSGVCTDIYVRTRHYCTFHGSWTSPDPLWPAEPVLVYCDSNPTSVTDPMGLAPCPRKPYDACYVCMYCRYLKKHSNKTEACESAIDFCGGSTQSCCFTETPIGNPLHPTCTELDCWDPGLPGGGWNESDNEKEEAEKCLQSDQKLDPRQSPRKRVASKDCPKGQGHTPIME